MAPGIIWVSSRISDPTPTSPDALTPSKFCTWYENTHIQEVTALPGVPHAARYEALPSQPDAEGWSVKAPWLTVYEMPDVEYRLTDEFKGLDGQSKPAEALLKGVFERARFDTRFYEEVDSFQSPASGQGPPKVLISWAVNKVDGVDVDKLKQVTGVSQVRRFKVVNGTVLERFVRRLGDMVDGLVLIGIDGEEVPVEKVKEAIWGELGEVGWYGLKRIYNEENK